MFQRMNHTPHPYQVNYANAIDKAFADGFRKIAVISPTGSGKGDMFSWEIEKAVNNFQSALVLVDQKKLAWQAKARLEEQCGITGEVEQAEYRASNKANVVFATVQTMAGRLDKWPKDAFDLIINDEADRSLADEWSGVLKHFDEKARVLGYTATPHRTDQKNLGHYYDQLVELENLKTLIQKGYLSPIKIQMLPIKIDVGAFGKGADFTNEEADAIITPHLEEMARQIEIHATFRRTLVFLPLIKTCEKFVELARNIGINCDYVYGGDPLEESKIAKFKSGQIDLLANAMLLTRGIDIPQADCALIGRPTKSITLYFQMAGRITRLAPGKSDALLLDPLYQATKRLICRPACLLAQTDEERDTITALTEKDAGLPAEVAGQLDLLEVAGEATSMREESLRKKLEENAHRKAQLISAEAFAMQHHNLALAEYEPIMPWQMKPVTDKQRKYLEEAKINVDSVKGMDHASKILDIYFKNKPLKLASHKVRGVMKRMGYMNWQNATEREGIAFFQKLNKQRKQPEMI
jgi:superfamily II DNA or RNA helicase